MTVVEFHSNQRIIEAMWRFLRRLHAGIEIGPVMGRLEDRARQKACKCGYASYTRAGSERGWKITKEGVEALVKLDSPC
jgi:hypothetical protein